MSWEAAGEGLREAPKISEVSFLLCWALHCVWKQFGICFSTTQENRCVPQSCMGTPTALHSLSFAIPCHPCASLPLGGPQEAWGGCPCPGSGPGTHSAPPPNLFALWSGYLATPGLSSPTQGHSQGESALQGQWLCLFQRRYRKQEFPTLPHWGELDSTEKAASIKKESPLPFPFVQTLPQPQPARAPPSSFAVLEGNLSPRLVGMNTGVAVLPRSCICSSRVNVAMTQDDGTPDAEELN